MKQLFITAILLLSPSLTAAQSKALKLAEVSTMSGCWEQRVDEKKIVTTEIWTAATGGVMLGMNLTARDGKASTWEYMRIEQRGDGLVFVSRPKENPTETEFTLIKSTADSIVFENKAHDYPQRVMYTISGDRLHGRVEGDMNGKLTAFDFPMVRVKCP